MAMRFVKSDTLLISVPHSCLRAGSDFESCSSFTSASWICAVWNLSSFRLSIQHSHHVRHSGFTVNPPYCGCT
jgi:hypothetical protein